MNHYVEINPAWQPPVDSWVSRAAQADTKCAAVLAAALVEHERVLALLQRLPVLDVARQVRDELEAAGVVLSVADLEANFLVAAPDPTERERISAGLVRQAKAVLAASIEPTVRRIERAVLDDFKRDLAAAEKVDAELAGKYSAPKASWVLIGGLRSACNVLSQRVAEKLSLDWHYSARLALEEWLGASLPAVAGNPALAA